MKRVLLLLSLVLLVAAVACALGFHTHEPLKVTVGLIAAALASYIAAQL